MGHSTESGIFQIQKNKTVIGTSLLNSKHSNNIKESKKKHVLQKIQPIHQQPKKV
jgi:hypothetical protein